ncbi:glutathione S-transferase family protein [Sagittula salina]|uniref:Glutathione S-transferase family protein n=1 Tax=Sagittula salina TaxID=2820268 RepID=A0A940RZW3_9RHOB|nr:glutathione S-transferase family protein [Sagittula salina]MBP0481536.1 glutathione S-transferase family protein [Sagittula salina]
MLTLYHSPMSRSSRIVTLIEELGAADTVRIVEVGIARQDGTGYRDPANPHPEGKVPALEHDGALILESIAIAQHLCELFPDAGLLPAAATPQRGKCLEWLAWYAGVIEPVVVAKFLNIDDPRFASNFRDWDTAMTRLTGALDGRDWLVGDHYTVADLIVHSLFNWMPDMLPDHHGTKAWHERIAARPAAQNTMARDRAAMEVE